MWVVILKNVMGKGGGALLAGWERGRLVSGTCGSLNLIFAITLQVNDILREHHKEELVLSVEDKKIMLSLVSLLATFKAESLELEKDGPTIQFAYLSYLRLVEVCSPKDGDSSEIQQVRVTLSRELQAKYTPHIRHYLGVFFWPKFRRLRYIPSEKRETVSKN